MQQASVAKGGEGNKGRAHPIEEGGSAGGRNPRGEGSAGVCGAPSCIPSCLNRRGHRPMARQRRRRRDLHSDRPCRRRHAVRHGAAGAAGAAECVAKSDSHECL
jgi:hypothetical protein